MTPTPSNTSSYNYVNDCEIITLFPLSVECLTITNPSSINSSDGAISLNISGGTTPYYIYWKGGQRTKDLVNIPVGIYEAVVVDYYGDYSATTICNLVASSVTPTPTPSVTNNLTPTPTPTNDVEPTPTPTPTTSQDIITLCVIVNGDPSFTSPILFTQNGALNGKPKYISGSYIMGWDNNLNRWWIDNWDYLGFPVSFTTSNIPNSGWELLGDVSGQIINVINGTCPSYIPMNSTISVQDTTCGNSNNCNGSIIITTTGGNSPYMYSINGGNTYQTSNIFNGLCPNTYSVIVKDSDNNMQTYSAIINSAKIRDTYRVSLTITSVQPIGNTEKITNWKVNVSPELPSGVNITFNLNLTNLKQINGPGTGIITINNSVYKNNVLLSPDIVSLDSVGYDRPYCSPESTEEISTYETYSITLGSGDVVTGSTYGSVSITDGQVSSNGCVTKLVQITRYGLSDGFISGCECCDVVVNIRTVETQLEIEYGDNGAIL